jgi:hypothetical protein
MSAINTTSNSYMDTLKKDYESSSNVQTSSSKLNMTQKKNAEMEIVTKDGDRVTLSYNSEASSGYQTYNQQGKTGDGVSWSASGRSEYSEFGLEKGISIEGSLDKDELKDIMKAAKNLEKALDRLTAGKTDEAVSALLDAADGKTVASLESTVSLMRSFEMSNTYSRTDIPEQDGQLKPLENEAPAADAGITNGPEKPQSFAGKTGKRDAESDVRKSVDEIRDIFNRTRETVNKNLSGLEKLFSRMFEQAEKNTGNKINDSGIHDFLKDMKKNLLDGLMNNINDQGIKKDMDV